MPEQIAVLIFWTVGCVLKNLVAYFYPGDERLLARGRAMYGSDG
jgi:hypothetical protein